MKVTTALAMAQPVVGSRSAANELLRWLTGNSELFLAPDLNEPQIEQLNQALAKLATGYPLQYLTGIAHFRTVSVAVGPGVFIPRPETEAMVEWAISRIQPDDLVVELCAGSGAISKALVTEAPNASYYAVELSDDAVTYAQQNLANTAVTLEHGDMAECFPDLNGKVDLVIANPPYIPLSMYESVAAPVREFEPTMALFSGDDGFDAIRVLLDVATRLLRSGGWLVFEHAEAQHPDVATLVTRDGRFGGVVDHLDLTHRPRYITAQFLGNFS